MTTAPMDEQALQALMTRMRPRLHRYCARMVGSSFDGEDVVQDAFLNATKALSQAGGIERPESWLFRIAHNAALDLLRRRRREATQFLDDMGDFADDAADAGGRMAAEASLSAFLVLPPAPRSCVILVDVLGYSLAETAGVLSITLAATKAALRRARVSLRSASPAFPGEAVLSRDERRRLHDYADRFNARDFDGLRQLLADDVRLDLVNRHRIDGRKDVAVYFTRYEEKTDWRFSPVLAEGRPALLVSNPLLGNDPPTHVVLLDWREGEIANIRDFKFADYIMDGLALQPFGP